MKSESRSYRQTARAQAAQDTGQRIVEAFLARLGSEWYDEITLERVARDAGVTVQTVVRRFGGKEGLLGEAVQTFTAQVKARRACPAGDVRLLVHHLLVDYEAVGDGVIRLLALESRYPALKTVLDFGRSQHRAWVREGFAPRDEPALDALVVITDVYTWKLLRRDLGRSLEQTRTLLEQMLKETMR